MTEIHDQIAEQQAQIAEFRAQLAKKEEELLKAQAWYELLCLLSCRLYYDRHRNFSWDVQTMHINY